jgi:two-component system, NarL family, response regulator DevR
VVRFLFDNHEVVRRGLVGPLASEPELGVVGEAGSVAEATVGYSASG